MEVRIGSTIRRWQAIAIQSVGMSFLFALCMFSSATVSAEADSVDRSTLPSAVQKDTGCDEGKQGSGLPANGEPRPEDEFWMISTRHLSGCSVKAEADLGLRVYRNGNGWTETVLDEFLDTQRMADKITIFYVHGNRVEPNDAEAEGRLVYRGLLETRPHMQPLRFVIWSWPSDRIRGLVRDIRLKGRRAEVHAVYLGELLTKVEQHAPPSLQISIIGYSYGARLALGALHLWGGGTMYGVQLDPPAGPPHRMQARVTLMAAAEHNYWLTPGSHHGSAPNRIDHLVVMRNSRDPVLRRYWMLDPRERGRALGYTGIAGMAQLPDSDRWIEHYNINHRSHDLNVYFYNDYFIEQMRRCVLWDPLD